MRLRRAFRGAVSAWFGGNRFGPLFNTQAVPTQPLLGSRFDDVGKTRDDNLESGVARASYSCRASYAQGVKHNDNIQ